MCLCAYVEYLSREWGTLVIGNLDLSAASVRLCLFS